MKGKSLVNPQEQERLYPTDDCSGVPGPDKALVEERDLLWRIVEYYLNRAYAALGDTEEVRACAARHAQRLALGTVVGRTKHALVAAFLAKHYGGVVGHGVDRPVGTVTAKDHHALTTAWLMKYYGESVGFRMDDPVPTVTASGNHLAEVRAFLVKYYGAQKSQQQSLFGPLHTVTARGRFGLVEVHGEKYAITDIGMRMLQPLELFAAQGFPTDYEIAPEFNGRPLTKTAQIALCGNAVCPQVAQAIVASNACAAG